MVKQIIKNSWRHPVVAVVLTITGLFLNINPILIIGIILLMMSSLEIFQKFGMIEFKYKFIPILKKPKYKKYNTDKVLDSIFDILTGTLTSIIIIIIYIIITGI